MRADAARAARRALLCLAMAVLAAAAAQGASLRGHVKVQQQFLAAAADSLAAALGPEKSAATSLDLRLIGRASKGRFGFAADYLLQAAAGSAVSLQQRIAAAEPGFVVDRRAMNWLPLDDTVTDTNHTQAVESLDRFSMSYTTDLWVFTLGRQAYSWGNGIVFRPMDLFDPFAPDAVDESYKPGIDAVYAQRLFADGSDVTALIVPRRDPVSGRLTSADSSAALKWHTSSGGLQIDLMLARDYRDEVLGLGLSGAWGQAVWRVSVVPTRLKAGGTRVSLVANLEHAWQWRGRNLSGFVEYFRNGFGRGGSGYTLDELGGALRARLARGQLFDSGRDYAAAGLRMQLTPLFDVDPTVLVNLRDGSALLLVQGDYSIAQNLNLVFGARGAAGPAGTEFGGLRPSPGAAVADTPPTRLYARIAWYF